MEAAGSLGPEISWQWNGMVSFFSIFHNRNMAFIEAVIHEQEDMLWGNNASEQLTMILLVVGSWELAVKIPDCQHCCRVPFGYLWMCLILTVTAYG